MNWNIVGIPSLLVLVCACGQSAPSGGAGSIGAGEHEFSQLYAPQIARQKELRSVANRLIKDNKEDYQWSDFDINLILESYAELSRINKDMGEAVASASVFSPEFKRSFEESNAREQSGIRATAIQLQRVIEIRRNRKMPIDWK